MRRASSIRAAHLAIGPKNAGKSISWKPSRSRSPRATSPMNRIIGVESWNATWTPMLALVAPGPRVTKPMPGRPVIVPSAQAMKAAPPSWRQTTSSISGVS